MANVCESRVVFYTDDKSKATDLEALFSSFMKLLNKNPRSSMVSWCKGEGIEVNDTQNARLCYVDISELDGSVTAEFKTYWTPASKMYSAIAGHYGLKMVYAAEEPGCDLFINTDMERRFLPDVYKVFIDESKAVEKITDLYNMCQSVGTCEFYFDSDESLMNWFNERGYKFGSIDEINQKLGDTVTVSEFVGVV